jgi:hypothetical protein
MKTNIFLIQLKLNLICLVSVQSILNKIHKLTLKKFKLKT